MSREGFSENTIFRPDLKKRNYSRNELEEEHSQQMEQKELRPRGDLIFTYQPQMLYVLQVPHDIFQCILMQLLRIPG